MENIKKLLDEAVVRTQNALCTILSALRKLYEKIPQTGGLFGASSDEKLTAYAATCVMILNLERARKDLQSASLLCSEAETCLTCAKKTNAVQVACNAAKDQTAELARVEEDLTRLRDALRRYDGEIVATFLCEAGRLADLEHEGKDCRPSAVLQLVGELKRETERLQITIEKQRADV